MIIAVARDEAFNFTYRENIDRLREWGEVVFFSPVHDASLPACDFLYLPGGYPEFFLQPLSDNTAMRRQVYDYIERGGRCLAECGGMMYLCTAIVGMDNVSYPMVNILKQTATLEDMKLHLGYREWNGFPGHEFHYSHIVESASPGNSRCPQVYEYKNLRASYIHLYWGEKNLFDLWKD